MAMAKARRWLALVALAIGLALVAGFGLRTWNAWQFTQRVMRGEIQVETLRGWMTLPYIARVHGVRESELRAALGLPASGHETRSLLEWFKAVGVEPEAGRKVIEDLILARDRPGSEPGP